jgi:rhodanese-related sulfurtransferase
MKQHSNRFQSMVAETKTRIREISPHALKEKIDRNELLYIIDVREESEWPMGHIPNAIHLSKGVVEREIEKTVADLHSPIITYCSGGFRSALAANALQKMGYTQVYSLNTGLQGWINAGYSLEQ